MEKNDIVDRKGLVNSLTKTEKFLSFLIVLKEITKAEKKAELSKLKKILIISWDKIDTLTIRKKR